MFLFYIVATVVFVEFGSTLVYEHYGYSLFLKNVVDAVILILIAFPVLYYLAYRPLVGEIDIHKNDLKSKQAILDTSLDGFWIVDMDGNFLDVNDAYCQLIGYSRDEILDMNIADISTRTKDENHKILQELKNSGGKYFTSQHRTKSGKVLDLEISANYLKTDVERVYVFLRDITRRLKELKILHSSNKKLEQLARSDEDAKTALVNVLEDLEKSKDEIEHKKAKDDAILASIGDGMVVVDSEGRITFMNHIAEQMLGWKMAELLGTEVDKSLPITDEKGTLLPFESRPISLALLNHTTIKASQYLFVRRDGTSFPVAIIVSPVIQEGKNIGAIDVFRDITKEKEVDKAKTEFVSLASHQLRSPPTSIKWYSDILMEAKVGSLNKKQKGYLQEIYRSNQRMIDLVNSLLTVSRIELGTFQIDPHPVHLSQIIDETVKELQVQIAKKKLQIGSKQGEDLVVETDPTLLRIVLENLLSNAIDYSPLKGKIIFETKKTDFGASIEISDSGIGIPEEAQGKIYTKFFRADNARAFKPDGNGLGLYIVKSIILALNGTISLRSNEVGTTFLVNLPMQGVAKRESYKKLL
ncbi:MAG: PAS domain S-box protein [Candidatus Doudnabacteria bacterium]